MFMEGNFVYVGSLMQLYVVTVLTVGPTHQFSIKHTLDYGQSYS